MIRTLLEERFGADLSDLDLLVVARGLPRSRFARRRLLGPIAHRMSKAFAETVSLIAYTPEEASTIKPFYLGAPRRTSGADRSGRLPRSPAR